MSLCSFLIWVEFCFYPQTDSQGRAGIYDPFAIGKITSEQSEACDGNSEKDHRK